MTRIAVYPVDNGGVGNYRLRWPAQAAAAQGHDVVTDTPTMTVKWTHDLGGNPPPLWADPVSVEISGPVDTMVFQRTMVAEWAKLIPLLRAQGIRVVVDVDDNMDAIATDNAVWPTAEPHWMHQSEIDELPRPIPVPVTVTRRSKDREWVYSPDYQGRSNRHHLKAAIAQADLLTVSTPALARHYGHLAETLVIPNRIPERYLQMPIRGSNPIPVVGWTGSVRTHPTDLGVIGGALVESRRMTVFDLRVIGSGEGFRERTGATPDSTTGWLPISDYPAAYAGLDVALCPLADSAFNHCKSWLKPLEAASLGVVPIMSPSPEYLALHEQGIGVIARNPRQWGAAIRRLVGNDSLRSELAAKGRAVAAGLTIESGVGAWMAAWT